MGDNGIYQGSGSELWGEQDGDFLKTEYRTSAASLGLATDPRLANQVDAASKHLNTGTKTIEISTIIPNVIDAIPEEHFDELKRLKEIVGAEFTLHGPLVEPSGFDRERGWSELQRQQNERQMWEALRKSNKINPEGNTVVTFHTNVGLPAPVMKSINEKTGKETIDMIGIVDNMSGNVQSIKLKEKYFPGTEINLADEQEVIKKEIESKNVEQWNKMLQNLGYHTFQGLDILDRDLQKLAMTSNLKEEKILDLYKRKDSNEMQKLTEGLTDEEKNNFKSALRDIMHGELYIRDSYVDFQNRFNDAYSLAVENMKSSNKEVKSQAQKDKEILDNYASEIRPLVETAGQDPSKIKELGNGLIKGIEVLKKVSTPSFISSLKDFAIDKTSETFSNLALRSYSTFHEHSPIISIENPPAYQGGLTTGKELRALIDETRNKFVQKAVESGMMKEKEAKKQAEKIIGATWDVGHINMLKKYGYDNDALIEQETAAVADVVKHVHLSDNFGLEHTELPMGMGNVPTERHLKMIQQYNSQVKKIIETGDWYQHFKTPPFGENLAAFGSPIYSMKMGPYWSQIQQQSGGYFAGYGLNPEVHHSMYGAGFSNLPPELGGQMSGRSRLSGAPME